MTNEQAIKELRICECYSVEPSVEALDMAIKALEQQSDDCVSRADLIDKLEILDKRYGTDFYWEVRKIVDDLPPVTPTQCIATVEFSKEDLREICNEHIEIECTHGACKDCKFNVKSTKSTTMCDIGHRFYMREPSTFYCADFVKRGNSDGSN